MVELTCSFNGCKNVVGYHNKTEDSYYWEYCAHAMFNPNEWTKIGNISVIRQMLRLSKNLLEKIRDYVNKEGLELKWRQPLEQLKAFDVKLEAINDEFENAINKNKIKDFSNIEEKSLNIKLK